MRITFKSLSNTKCYKTNAVTLTLFFLVLFFKRKYLELNCLLVFSNFIFLCHEKAMVHGYDILYFEPILNCRLRVAEIQFSVDSLTSFQLICDLFEAIKQ